MTRRTKKESRTRGRRWDTAIKLLLLGFGLMLAPVFFRNTVLAKGLGLLFPLGLTLALAGAALLWWAKSQDRKIGSPSAIPYRAPGATREAGQTSSQPGYATPLEVTDVVPGAPTSPEAPSPSAGTSQVPDRRPATWGPEVFAIIEWRRFEAVIERLFQQAGFETRSQSHGADMGVDVWLYSKTSPAQPVSVVQCKHWQGKRVGVDKIRELRGVMAAHNVARGQFATASTFTPDAVAFGKENSINLLDVDHLLALISQRTSEQQAELLEVALEGEYWRPTCVNCGTKLINRTPRKGGNAFWGCPTYPRCKTTMPMRQA